MLNQNFVGLTKRWNNNSFLRDACAVIVEIIACIVGLPLLVSTVQSADPTAGRIYYVSGSRFDVSIELWKLEKNDTPVKVECSLDQGKTWQPVLHPEGSSISRTQSFGFRAQSDGTYFFRLHSLRAEQPVIHSPIIVVVDSKRPSADLVVELDHKGRWIANCVISDANLNPDSLHVDYRTSEAEPWLQSYVQLTQTTNALAWRGECELENSRQDRRMQVRLVGKDYAGNAFQVVRFPELITASPIDLSQKVASDLPNRFSPGTEAEQVTINREQPSPYSTASYSFPTPRDGPTALPQAVNPSLAGRASLMPSNAVYSNTREFKLDFALEQNAAKAVEIELWATTDSGQTWSPWGVSDSPEDPLQVEVVEDGNFGFYLSPIVRSGTKPVPPAPGQEPTIWVVVDTTNPNPKITNARLQEGTESVLTIDYDCFSDDVASRSTTLSWSERPQGPWNTIESELPNSGRYLWQCDNTRPGTFYLKIEAIDRASNVGGHVFPVDFDSIKRGSKQRMSRRSNKLSPHQ